MVYFFLSFRLSKYYSPAHFLALEDSRIIFMLPGDEIGALDSSVNNVYNLRSQFFYTKCLNLKL